MDVEHLGRYHNTAISCMNGALRRWDHCPGILPKPWHVIAERGTYHATEWHRHYIVPFPHPQWFNGSSGMRLNMTIIRLSATRIFRNIIHGVREAYIDRSCRGPHPVASPAAQSHNRRRFQDY